MLKHDRLTNTEVATSFGMLKFDEEGISNDLTKKQQEELGKLRGFTYATSKEEKEAEEAAKKATEEKQKEEDEKTAALREKAEKAEVQVDDKNEDPTKTVKKTATPRKAAPKKAAAKK